MRLILDTDVVVAAQRSPSGGSAAVIRLLDEGYGTLLLSTALLIEYAAVCQRPEHRAATGLSVADVDLFLDTLADMAERVEAFFRWRPQVRDEDDELVLEAAVNGRATATVTFNRRDYGDAPRRFGVEVLSLGDVLRRMRT